MIFCIHAEPVAKNLDKKESHCDNAAHIQNVQVDFFTSWLLCPMQNNLLWFLVERANLILINPGAVVSMI